eukprot:CAMPEP_0119302618 /NCGR_PEP_ID=MMETSP1333-20130426/4185_1 /TAXON_ID=418940 /ORGANISM="Scyphosphaera apsteinii, Strain RCC1455" /LENGTH=388 /DNA_ID=CAMNT_0007305025 /DNA_START=29 /DNA_END=1195 /DNA_ORIENTATION=-
MMLLGLQMMLVAPLCQLSSCRHRVTILSPSRHRHCAAPPLAKASSFGSLQAKWSRSACARGTLALVAATYGSNYACVKLLDGWIGSPAEAATLRFSIACAATLPALVILGKRSPRIVQWPLARDGLLVGVYFAAGYAVQAMALETSSAGLQAFLLSLSVIVCPILEQVFDSKQQPARVWWAAAVAMLGVAALESGNLACGGLSRGDMLGLLQPIFFGAGFFECERAMRRHKDGPRDMATPMALTAWNLVAVLLLSLAWLHLAGGRAELQDIAASILSSPAEHLCIIAAVLWTGLVTTAGCSLAEASSLGDITASDATVVFATEPLWGALFAYVMLGERIGPSTAAGGLLMVLACLISGSSEFDLASPTSCFPHLRESSLGSIERPMGQ